MKMKHEVTALDAAWPSRHARWIEAGLPANSPEVSDDEDNLAMETGSGDTVPAPTCVHAGFTMEQAQAHYKTTMAEHRPMKRYIYVEPPSKEVVVTMAEVNPNFVAVQCALYDALRVQVVSHE
ncbi:NHL repeat-containing protein 2 [Hordeum vulgare]|nr:NHL repeat-containing protein 2 [Hordeum vulgare]